MKILGIDQGIASMGYCLLYIDDKTGKRCVCEYGQLSTYPDENDPDLCYRLAYLGDTLLEMVEEMQPDRICCEKLFFSPPRGERNKSASIVNTNIASGLIMYVCGKTETEFKEYSPLSVKNRITGNGTADKDLVREGVLKLYPEMKDEEQYMTEHMIDAIAIATTSDIISKEEELEVLQESETKATEDKNGQKEKGLKRNNKLKTEIKVKNKKRKVFKNKS